MLKVKILCYAFLLLGLVTMGTAIHHSGYNSGVNATKLKYEVQIISVNKRVRTLEDEISDAKAEQQKATQDYLVQIDEAYQKGKEDAENKTVDSIISAANATGGLSVHVRRDESPTNCPSSGTATSTPKHHDLQRARLSEKDAAFFISEAKRADSVTRQLGACQEVVVAYRGAVASYQKAIEDVLAQWPKK